MISKIDKYSFNNGNKLELVFTGKITIQEIKSKILVTKKLFDIDPKVYIYGDFDSEGDILFMSSPYEVIKIGTKEITVKHDNEQYIITLDSEEEFQLRLII
jgi:hypothetical protein